MGRLSTRVTTDGLINASSVVWRVGAKVRVTVVAKACLEFGLGAHASQTQLVRPLPVFVKDRWAAGDTELSAVSDIAPFIPTPEVVVVGRPPQRVGRTRVGVRVEREGQSIIDKHVDAEANTPIAALGPRPSNWPVAPEAFQQGIVTLQSLDGGAFQRAAEDQRVLDLRGSEDVVLIGLYQANPLVRFQLRAPTVEALVRCGPHEDAVPFRIDMLSISLAERKCTLLWRGSVPLRSEQGLSELSVRVSCRPDPRAPVKAEPAPRVGHVRPAEGMGTVSLDPADDDAMRTAGMPAELPFRSPKSSKGLPFPEAPRSQELEPKPSSAPVSGTPWAGENVVFIAKPADGRFDTLPLSERLPSPPQTPPPVPVSEEVVAKPPASQSPWREDPPAAQQASDPARAPVAPVAAPAASPFKAPKKDLNASLYRRPKPR